MDGSHVARRCLIEGRVQGVGYRYWTRDKAHSLGLRGWVRNLPDGRVEALFAGSKETVAQMIEHCRQGPALSQVHSITEEDGDAPDQPGFAILR